MNPFLNDFQPIEYLARGRVEDVIGAAKAFKAGSFA